MAIRPVSCLLTIAIAAFLAIAVAGPAMAGASPVTKVARAHSLGRSDACSRLEHRRARLNPRRRRQLMRRVLSCRHRVATQSSAPAQAPLYWGASIGSQLTGTQAPWDMSAVTKFEGLVQKQLSLINFFVPFANCGNASCSFYKFPQAPIESIRQDGAIPILSWSSQSIPSSLEEPDFQLSDVISGRYDSYIKSFAEEAHRWGHPFFLRFDWEMNGNWFPWSEGVNGNKDGEFVAVWRHVHDIFTSVGATNVSWVWCPNVDPASKLQNVDSLYPGDEYVDWTGLDGYNWGPAKGGWATFDHLFGDTYHHIADTLAPSKPMLIGEMGSTENGGSKANWISEALTAIPSDFPKIRGALWFDTFDSGMDWPIETSTSATNAFTAGIQNPAYVGNSFANLPPTSIAPPS